MAFFKKDKKKLSGKDLEKRISRVNKEKSRLQKVKTLKQREKEVKDLQRAFEPTATQKVSKSLDKAVKVAGKGFNALVPPKDKMAAKKLVKKSKGKKSKKKGLDNIRAPDLKPPKFDKLF